MRISKQIWRALGGCANPKVYRRQMCRRAMAVLLPGNSMMMRFYRRLVTLLVLVALVLGFTEVVK